MNKINSSSEYINKIMLTNSSTRACARKLITFEDGCE
jgi:hypothetical protein